MSAVLLRVHEVSKRFQENGVLAVDRASLQVDAGEIRAIVGENGAGKTTLMQIIAGTLSADAGVVSIGGQRLEPGDAAGARALGVVMSYQHPRVDRSLTVLENLFLGEEPRRLGLLFDRRRARARLRAIAPDLPDRMLNARLGRLSSGQVRMVSIAAALLRMPPERPGLLILDEPTEATTPDEADRVFEIIRSSASAGHAVIFITHRLPEVGRAAHTVTVLRGGRSVGTYSADLDTAALSSAMVGEPKAEERPASVPTAKRPHEGVPRLRLAGLTVERSGRRLLSAVTLSVRTGEIVGLTGIRENGIEAMEGLLAGKLAPTSGTFELDGRTVNDLSPSALRSLGLRYVPTDRLLRGASVESSVSENLIALKRRHLQRAGMLDSTNVAHFASSLQASYGIDAALHLPLWQLSGGNIQKVILSRELEGDPRLLVICEPSWGLDFRTRGLIVERIRAAAHRGAAVILISTDIDEVVELADRVLVLFDAEVIGEFDRPRSSRRDIGQAMAGVVSAGEPRAC